MDLKTEILGIPERIKVEEITLIEMKGVTESLLKELETIQTKVRLEVRLEPDLTNPSKLQFTNDFMRDTETRERLGENDEFLRISNLVKKREYDTALEEVELKFLYNRFAALRAIARLKLFSDD